MPRLARDIACPTPARPCYRHGVPSVVHRRVLSLLTAALVGGLVSFAAGQPRPAAPGLPGAPYAPAPAEETAIPSGAGVSLSLQGPVSVLPLLPPETVIAHGRGVSVTAGEFTGRLRDAPPALLHTYATEPSALQGLIDRLVGDQMLAAEAIRRGLDRDPIVRATVQRALIARLRAVAINPTAGTITSVTDTDARDWYNAHPERFHIPERRRVRVIFATLRRDALSALRLAIQRRRGRYVRDFRTLAAERNTDPTLHALSGEVHELTPTSTDIDRGLRDAVFAIPHEGDVLPRLVQARWARTPGWFVVRLVGRRAAIDRSFAESADWIRGRMVLERRVAAEHAFATELAHNANVQETTLDQVVRFQAVPPDGGVSSAMDAGAD